MVEDCQPTRAVTAATDDDEGADPLGGCMLVWTARLALMLRSSRRSVFSARRIVP